MDAARLPVGEGNRLGGSAGWWAAVALASSTLLLLAGTVPLSNSAKMSSGVGAAFVVVLIAFVVVGLVLVRTRPGNPIGWAMLVGGLFGGLTSFAGAYAVNAYRLHHQLPLAPIAVFVQPAWAPSIFLIALALMLFPDGALPSGSWRWAMGTLAVVGAVWMIGAFAIAGEAIALGQVRVEPSGDLYRIDHPTSAWAWWSVVQMIFFVELLCVGVLWLVSRVPAYRSATGARREQLKWLIFGGSFACVGVVLSVTLSSQSGLLGVIGSVSILGLLGIPVSIGIGITRYRLYDIDRLISRTLSYTLLTGALAAVFVGLVLLTTRVLPFSSPVGVAISTLIAAALFNPLRLWLQRLVDAHFNRSRYDAEALVATFSAHLRSGADLDTIRRGLLETATRAVEPAHVSVWLHDDPTG